MPETNRESINRGNNLLAVGYLSVTSVAVLGLVFAEADWADKLDDIAIVVLAVIALIWYFSGRNRYQRSLVPLSLLGISFLAKVAALVIEFGDPASAGDDYGIVAAFFVATVAVAIILYRTREKTSV